MTDTTYRTTAGRLATIPAQSRLRREKAPSAQPAGQRYAAIAATAVAYWAVAKVGLETTALPGNVTPVWPPTGVALAVLLIGGLRWWPGVAAGALLVNATTDVPLAAAAGMALGNTAEALLGAWVFRTVLRGDVALARVRDVVAFTLTVAVAAAPVSATVGVVSLRLAGITPGSELWTTWRVWWVGDLLGALVITPLALAYRPSRPGGRTARAVRVDALLVAAMLGVGMLALAASRFNHPYLVFPGLIWATLRWRLRGATLTTLLLTVASVLATREDIGAFHSDDTALDLWRLATFLITLSTTGLVLAAVVVERDAQAAHNAELIDALARNVSELEQTKRELESFAYSVSHDLRAPLRNIDGFARNLARNSAAVLDEQGAHQLQRIRANARSMGTLIDALLSFSRLQRQPLHRRDVAMGDVVAAALEMTESAREGRDVVLHVTPLPTACVDRDLLVQVYANLIGNALKFTRDTERARITIGHRVVADVDEFFVADNGVGFDPRYADRMFGVFQRLHRMEDYEGCGIGLALVDRIVTRHGGRVRADGVPGRGATLSFTLGEPTP